MSRDGADVFSSRVLSMDLLFCLKTFLFLAGLMFSFFLSRTLHFHVLAALFIVSASCCLEVLLQLLAPDVKSLLFLAEFMDFINLIISCSFKILCLLVRTPSSSELRDFLRRDDISHSRLSDLMNLFLIILMKSSQVMTRTD